MGIGTKIIEILGGTNRGSSWKNIITQAGGKAWDQAKNAPLPAKVGAGVVAVAGAGAGAYFGVAAPMKRTRAFAGRDVYMKTQGGVFFTLTVVAVTSDGFYGVSVDKHGDAHYVAVAAKRVTLYADAACTRLIDADWMKASIKGYAARKESIAALHKDVQNKEAMRIAA